MSTPGIAGTACRFTTRAHAVRGLSPRKAGAPLWLDGDAPLEGLNNHLKRRWNVVHKSIATLRHS